MNNAYLSRLSETDFINSTINLIIGDAGVGVTHLVKTQLGYIWEHTDDQIIVISTNDKSSIYSHDRLLLLNTSYPAELPAALNIAWEKIKTNHAFGKKTWLAFFDAEEYFLDEKFEEQLCGITKRLRTRSGHIIFPLNSKLDFTNYTLRTMLNFASGITLLHQSPEQLDDLQKRLCFSEEEKHYLLSAIIGEGLIYNSIENKWRKF